MKSNCNAYDRWTVDLACGRVPRHVNATPKSELRVLHSLSVLLFPLLAMLLAHRNDAAINEAGVFGTPEFIDVAGISLRVATTYRPIGNHL
jgi:hypothetical protein